MQKKQLLFLLILFSVALLLWACGGEKTTETTEQKPVTKKAVYFNVSLSTEPSEVKPKEKAKLIFSMQDASTKDISINDLEIVHEKPMHLIVVSEDLSFFNHIHPMPTSDGSIFEVETEFPNAGKYRFYLDYSPKSVGHRLARLDINVIGTVPAAIELVEDKTDFQIIEDLKVTIKPEKAFQANEALTLAFLVEDAKTGKPITDIEPYLGAFAHFNIIKQDHSETLHAHPLVEAKSKDERGGPEIGTRTIFPKPGLYKIWTQFQRKGKVIVAPFIINVAEGKAQSEAILAKNDSGVQKLKVTVDKDGFTPTNFQLKPGVPAQITFIRADEKNCGEEVLFTELGIRKELPLGKEILVEFTPDKTSGYEFTCGMGMLKGNVLVK
ncbi:MAG: cupredoxin domain-containing protein [Acidobacteria bacterium]|nr:cupredoxin domain-containing protein [Acidobacteriota bacterium]